MKIVHEPYPRPCMDCGKPTLLAYICADCFVKRGYDKLPLTHSK